MTEFPNGMQVYCNVIKELFSLEVNPEETLGLFGAVGLVNPGGAPYRDIREAYFMGVDQNQGLIDGCNQVKEALGFKNMNFYASKIIDFERPEEVDEVHMVFSLHACDTATDETIAKGIQLKARYILVAPCCHREITRQLGRVSPLRGLTEKHLLREQLGIILTETLRTLVLEAAGYWVDIFTFVPSRYTPKNLMIRAERTGRQRLEALQRYHELKEFFSLRPRIENFLPQVLGKGAVTEEAFI